MITLFTGRHVGGIKRSTNMAAPYQALILWRTFRRISQLWDNAHALNLENCLLYLSSTISQFFDFIRCIDFDFIFYCVTVHTLYILWSLHPSQSQLSLWQTIPNQIKWTKKERTLPIFVCLSHDILQIF